MAKLGSFAVGGRDSHPDQCVDQATTSHWRSWEASPPIARSPSHSAKV
ncbi:MAG: hypothetical protein IJR26_09835 [Bacteroidales bacterium]|nr:hypothetical protein [Bacteroidales bacterium]